MSRKKKIVFTAVIGGIAAILMGAAAFFIVREVRTCEYQSRYLSQWAAQCTFTVAPGPSERILFPVHGPHNERRGYTRLPTIITELIDHGYRIDRQAVISPEMGELFTQGLNLIYEDRDQAGLTILDRSGKSLYRAFSPFPVYTSFDSIPAIILNALLFIEDRALLDSTSLNKNPAVDWARFLRSLVQYAASKLGRQGNVPGASTLATQIEKYRYFPEGRTSSASDKLRQMLSASLRAYRLGPSTIDTRRMIALSYLNTAPLAAFPHYGEVNGLGEGLAVWYGASFDSVNTVLRSPDDSPQISGRYLRMVVSLFIAHRRPNFYLLGPSVALDTKVDQYLRLMLRQGIITEDVCREALTVRLQRRTSGRERPDMIPLVIKKPVGAVRIPLLPVLGIRRLYELDRIDATVTTTLDSPAVSSVNTLFRNLRRTTFLDSLGLRGFRLLQKGDPSRVIYSISLYERVGARNLLRVQVDSHEDPLNINEGIKLDLGSTAKLRTLITYLEAVEELHTELSPLSRAELSAKTFHAEDAISRWAQQYLLAHPQAPLSAMLDDALQRSYSANPRERFYTGGGVHTFVNFDPRHNDRSMSVLEAFRHSTNLVFVRLMRDIVRYHTYRVPEIRNLLTDTTGAVRDVYLRRFIEHESRVFLSRFYRQLRDVGPHRMADTLVASIRPTPGRLAAIYATVVDSPTQAGFHAFLIRHGFNDTGSKRIERIYAQNTASHLTLSDRGFLAHLHPLKLWTAAYLTRNPTATLQELQEASLPYLENVYRWLFRTGHVSARNIRIRRMVEMEAFSTIHQGWQRLGFPFPELVASYATSLGASADRPSSLTELVGIIQNDGMRYPMERFERMEFAAGTPYETVMSRQAPGEAQRVLSVAVARATRTCLYDVVDNGTAQRALRAFRRDKEAVRIGGKTGTGDHRLRRFGAGGRKIEERVLNRTATFSFILGSRFFGTISTMVPGESAREFAFTSSYPVQLLCHLAPELHALIETDVDSSTIVAVDPARDKALEAAGFPADEVHELSIEIAVDSLAKRAGTPQPGRHLQEEDDDDEDDEDEDEDPDTLNGDRPQANQQIPQSSIH